MIQKSRVGIVARFAAGPAWRLWALAAVAGVAVIVALIWALSGGTSAPTERPRVAYLSSIALAQGEGDIADVVSGAAAADPLYARLNERFDLQPIDDMTRIGALSPRALLLIQPRGLSAEENVALDTWVRGGGRLMLLTDPALMRESQYPLGDKRRPVFTALTSPLLSHWGLELTLPIEEAEAVVSRTIDDAQFETAAPGRFAYKGKGAETTAPCRIKADGLIARCDVGKGRAILVADADFIDPQIWDAGGLLSDDAAITWLEQELDALSGS